MISWSRCSVVWREAKSHSSHGQEVRQGTGLESQDPLQERSSTDLKTSHEALSYKGSFTPTGTTLGAMLEHISLWTHEEEQYLIISGL